MASPPKKPWPDYVVRRDRIATVILIVCLAVSVLGPVVFDSLLGRGRRLPEWASPMLFAVSLAEYALYIGANRRRLRRAAEAAEFTLCTHCAYDISSLERTRKEGEDGRHLRCPECGTLVDVREARVLWLDYLK
jgi:hypothetical protein